jgi:ribosomal protein S18 acetylase RimI-like enzyme
MISVRVATPSEFDLVGAITFAAYADLLGTDDLGEYGAQLHDVEGRARDAVLLVAVEGEEILGTLTYVPGPQSPLAEFSDPGAAGLRMLAVDPERQRRGAARALVTEAIDQAQAMGRRTLRLHSTAPMIAAQHLYLELGFTRTEDDDEVVHDGEREIRLLAYALDLTSQTAS